MEVNENVIPELDSSMVEVLTSVHFLFLCAVCYVTAILSLCGCLANLIFFASFPTQRHFLNRTGLISLSISNFFLSLTFLIPRAVFLFFTEDYLDETVCVLQGFLLTFFLNQNLFWIDSIALNTYMFASFGIKLVNFEWVYHACAYALPFLVSTVPLLWNRYGTEESSHIAWCRVKSTPSDKYNYMGLLSFYIPLLLSWVGQTIVISLVLVQYIFLWLRERGSGREEGSFSIHPVGVKMKASRVLIIAFRSQIRYLTVNFLIWSFPFLSFLIENMVRRHIEKFFIIEFVSFMLSFLVTALMPLQGFANSVMYTSMTKIAIPRDFQQILVYDDAVKFFRKFLDAASATENLDFILAANAISKETKDEWRKELILDAKERFLTNSSPDCINISREARDSALTKIAETDNPTGDVLQAPYDEIMQMLQGDLFPRFRKSELAADLELILRVRAAGGSYVFIEAWRLIFLKLKSSLWRISDMLRLSPDNIEQGIREDTVNLLSEE